ncbi:MAG TPA: ATP-binding protein, partial [Gemmatimonadaceae bacterium]|nr:ATP-binding protein [Gemmatimonadaceae bacterium]
MAPSPIATIRGRLRRTSLGIKLAVLGAVVIATVITAAFIGLGVQIRGVTRDLLVDQLAYNQRTLQELQRRNANQLLFAASLATQSPQFQYSLKTYQVEANAGQRPNAALAREIQEELRQLAGSLGAEFILVTDASGRVFASAGPRALAVAGGTSIASLPALQHVLDPKARADTGELAFLRLGDTHLEVAAYPLVQAGYTLGSLLVGERLDSTFVASARGAANAAVVLTAGDSVVSASSPALGQQSTASILKAHANDASPSTARIGGEDYIVAPVPLGETQDHDAVRLWMLQPLSERVAAITTPLARQFAVYGVLAVLVAALGAGFVVRRVLGPFYRFVRHMRSGAASEDLDATFEAEREAREIRILNGSFNQLMGSLAARRRDLEQRTAELAAANVVLTDEINERIRVEQALRESEAQLRQSQKLEAIGTLAGGIAHDFNNLITVISGYTQLALMRADKASPAAEDLKHVVEASDRAANLTHQLLAFSRKQVLQPSVLDLDDVVSAIVPMLRRLIGEQIELRIVSGAPLARVRADRGQLEQVLLNLAVNARDAMTGGGVRGGGTLTILTRNELDSPSATDTDRAAIRAVSLIVSDTGSGMSEETKERIFEPFFTTKEIGKGTGLGLSTVYGIVNQSGGAVEVDTALGRGTSFVVTLPVADAMSEAEVFLPEDTPLP